MSLVTWIALLLNRGLQETILVAPINLDVIPFSSILACRSIVAASKTVWDFSSSFLTEAPPKSHDPPVFCYKNRGRGRLVSGIITTAFVDRQYDNDGMLPHTAAAWLCKFSIRFVNRWL